MGKVYLKTRYDNGMKMEIPHSFNMANAMYGFRELGAEIIPYHVIDEIYDKVQREARHLQGKSYKVLPIWLDAAIIVRIMKCLSVNPWIFVLNGDASSYMMS